MAIARGAGTEIIRAHHFENITNSDKILIFGVQHHIYTVLSIIVHAVAVASSTSFFKVYLKAYDANGSDTQQDMLIWQKEMVATDTYVWNDKFSFNGHEPTDFTGSMNSIADQDLIADQASAVPQYLYGTGEAGADNWDVHVTYIDQNNS